MEQKLYLYNTEKETIMNIETTKLELMQLLLQTQKESLLTKLRKVFDEESSTFYLNKISDLQQRTEASLKAIEKGETRPIQEFKSEVDHWKREQAI